MRPKDLFELLLLAALWGASFLFMRLGVHEFGPVAMGAVRVALAAVALLPLVALHGQWDGLRAHWRGIAFVGLVGSALPFLAFGYAAQWIHGSLASIFNATTPLWGALIAWWWLGDRPTPTQGAGLALGFAGVVWLVVDKASGGAAAAAGAPPSQALWAVLACVLAPLGYGIAANFTRRRLAGTPPLAQAAGSQLAAAGVLAVPGIALWPAQAPGATAWGSVLVLGIACTALAYLLYFRLIAQIGPARAMTVTYLIPLFASAWGVLFLDERVTPVMAMAGAVILAGTALATGWWKPGRSPAA